MRIGELATLVGVSTRTVRHYHHVRVLPEPTRSANGYREYGSRTRCCWFASGSTMSPHPWRPCGPRAHTGRRSNGTGSCCRCSAATTVQDSVSCSPLSRVGRIDGGQSGRRLRPFRCARGGPAARAGARGRTGSRDPRRVPYAVDQPGRAGLGSVRPAHLTLIGVGLAPGQRIVVDAVISLLCTTGKPR